MRAYFAHTLQGRSPEDWHLLIDHLLDTEERAGGFAAAFNAEAWGRLLGLWHDLGKYSGEFQDYLLGASGRPDLIEGSEILGRVDHSTAGAQHAASLGPLGQLLAYAIAGHHAGLPDNVDETAGLVQRLRKVIPAFHAPPELLAKACPSPPRLHSRPGSRRRAFTLGFFTRMIFSCLVDADFLDTERALDLSRAMIREREPATPEALLDALDEHLAGKMRTAPDTPVNKVRREVLDACRAGASLPPGFFSLNVPTGGGKTLSSLAFGLTHAKTHGLRRVVYAIPFTSIIEQTANVFRDALGGFSGEVLEHHSNLDPDDPLRHDGRSKLAAENFDSPVVVTTNVQLFESLFAARPSRCRKLHRLTKSLIILDEAQTLPTGLLAPTLAALEELVANYDASVILCTATQPAVERRETFSIGLTGVRPIVADPAALHRALNRTIVERLGPLDNAALAARLRGHDRALCIVNSRRHALDVFRELDDPGALHLSASMCAAHRSQVVEEIRRRLEPGRVRPCRVVSTQVIEAGVDVDFPAVYRAEAGLDSIAQAAGRCNREGLLTDDQGHPTPGRVYVFEYDCRAYPTAPLIRDAAQSFREVAPDHLHDLLSPYAVESYFALHYWRQGRANNGWDKGKGEVSILERFDLSPRIGLHAQFREVAAAYQLIDDAQTSILVPHGEKGRRLIDRLENLPEFPEPRQLRAFDRDAQRYTVGVFDHDLRRLAANGVLLERHGRLYLGNRDAYDDRAGLNHEALGLDPDHNIL